MLMRKGMKNILYVCFAFLMITRSCQELVRGFSNDEIERTILAHNIARRSVMPSASNMRVMRWSSLLAEIAQAEADECTGHHSNNGYGENIYLSSEDFFNVEGAVGAWFNETYFYDFDENYCMEGKMCGHYTQVVWSNSDEVGCGAVIGCPGKYRTIIFCSYNPPGNVNGGRPYNVGIPCSGCRACDHFCTERLCQKNSTGICSDCYSGDGSPYNGVANITVNGRACQKWSSIVPGLEDHNHCRNIHASFPFPMCYIALGSYTVEQCDVPNCGN